ncbi:hypothetical protein COCSADRAFT_36966 [Bipolaris sorokiniana ND90Pr]|uniref:Uncharacterized protein n=1 Tax=Cochliobolus sativus (strain ND90Pr / ATCC 201652) TaxID=665912 RepID=M2T567_COCSN|nr:uncharacterized protein COCSADRAFT_36966 [Bipolaris sorokiniana ND90Pr]EMD64401.1 hypothetical protein COCSADRAFT_36966 [Bipolaris sorokiniana ND90Pr]
MLPGYTCVKRLSGNTLTVLVAVTVIVATAPRYGWQSPGTGPVHPFICCSRTMEATLLVT